MITALVLDFGGVLTNNFWGVLGMELLRGLERGSIGQAGFEREMSVRLGLKPDGLLASMAADLRPDEQMLATVAELRAAGVKIDILSNSWGSDYFDPYAPWQLDTRADVVIISDQVRMRKPDPEIFDLATDKLGVAASECLFIDDIAAYLEPAKAKGMQVWHHTDTGETIAELRKVFSGFLR